MKQGKVTSEHYKSGTYSLCGQFCVEHFSLSFPVFHCTPVFSRDHGVLLTCIVQEKGTLNVLLLCHWLPHSNSGVAVHHSDAGNFKSPSTVGLVAMFQNRTNGISIEKYSAAHPAGK
jgi:hypothetical protein